MFIPPPSIPHPKTSPMTPHTHTSPTPTERYSGPGRRGTSRPLTDDEHTAWTTAVSRWSTSRPWTAQVLADNAAVRTLLVDLYEDGVALTTLADAAGWGYPQTAGILRRARQEGRGTGTRRYIAPAPAPTVASEPFRRDLTETERAHLARLKAAVPTRSTGALNWRSPQAADLRTAMARLHTDQVALSTLGQALGMTRQAVHQHLARATAEQAAA